MVSTKEGGRVISDNKAFKGGMIVYTSASPTNIIVGAYFTTFKLTLYVRAT